MLPDGEVGGKTLWVTGCSSGIGRAISEKLLEASFRVIGLARNPERSGIRHPEFQPVSVDLSDLESLPEQLRALLGSSPPHGVVFSAGRGRFGSLEEFSPGQIRDLIDLNFTSSAIVTRMVLPVMKRAGGGELIYIGSEAAVTGGRRGAVYSASKFALRGLAQSLRDECAKSGVRVCMIHPGMVRTPFFEDLAFAPGEQADNYVLPEDVAEAVLMVVRARSGTVFDEINLSPLKKVVRVKKPEGGTPPS